MHMICVVPIVSVSGALAVGSWSMELQPTSCGHSLLLLQEHCALHY